MSIPLYTSAAVNSLLFGVYGGLLDTMVNRRLGIEKNVENSNIKNEADEIPIGEILVTPNAATVSNYNE